MDSKESSRSRSFEGDNKGSEPSYNRLHSDELRVSCSGDITFEDCHELSGANGSENRNPTVSAFESSVEAVGSPPVAANALRGGTIMIETEISSSSSQSPPSVTAVVESSPPVLRKGSGPRRWRRLRQELKKDGSSSADSAQILKRRLSDTEPSKGHEESKLKSKAEAEGEESAASLESRDVVNKAHLVVTGTLDPELEVLVSNGFSIGMDSDNSGDHSSRSSTAASAPRLRHEALRTGWDRGKVKSFGWKGSTSLGPHNIQQGREGTVDSSKKIRDNLDRYEKENSLSSVESDMKSSVVGIMQCGGSVVNCSGKHNGRSFKLDEQGDNARSGEEVRSGYYKENRKAENPFIDDSCGKLLGENNQNSEVCQSYSDLDPSTKSMFFLQEAQEVLEQEIEKMGAIGTEQVNDKLFEGMEATSSPTLEARLVDLKKKIENLESELEEASTTIKAKEQRLRELEALLGNDHLPKIDPTSAHLSSMQQGEEDVSSELEFLLKVNMEAEIEYFILSRATRCWKILSEDRLALFNEQKHLAPDQERMMLKIREAEEKTVKLSEQTHMLAEYCRELAGMENVLRLQNSVCKFSLCFMFQLMFLFVALGLFLVHLLSPADGVVPT